MKKTCLFAFLVLTVTIAFSLEANVVIFNNFPQNAFYLEIDNTEDTVFITPKSRVELLLEPGTHSIKIAKTFNSLVQSDRFLQIFPYDYKFKSLEFIIDGEDQVCIEIKTMQGEQYITPVVSNRAMPEIRTKFRLSDPFFKEKMTARESYCFFSVAYFLEPYLLGLFNPSLDTIGFESLCPFALEVGYRWTLSEKGGVLAEVRACSATFVDDATTMLGIFGSLTLLKIPALLSPFRTIGIGIMNEIYGGINSGSVKLSPKILPAFFFESDLPLYVSRDFILSSTVRVMCTYEKDFGYDSSNVSTAHYPITLYSGLQFEF